MRNRLFVSAAVCVLAATFAARAEETRLADATMKRDVATVRALLKQGEDPNVAHGDGMTALHWAARQGDADVAQMLIHAGANVRATTRLGGYTPLLVASQLGHAGVMRTLVKAGADVKRATTAGTTALMFAAASGNVDAVKLLLDHGADLAAKENTRGQTALMFAAAHGRVDVMKVLVAAGADITGTSKVVNLTGETNPDEEEFLRVQRQGGPGRAAGGYAAPDAGRAGNPGQAAAAPAQPAQARPSTGSGQVAEGRGGRGGRGAGGPDVAGLTRQFRFAELVSAHGGLTPLLFAVRQGFADAAALLLDAGADVNQISAGDRTSPLLMATINGHFDLAMQLLARGANPNLASDNGVTPLYAALNIQWAPKALYPQPRAHLQQRTPYLDYMKALIDKGADVNARVKKKVWYSGYNFDLSGVDEIGATAFWRAAYASDVDAMKLLVAHGADPNIPTMKPAGRPRTGDAGRETVDDVSGQPPVPTGGPGVPPLQAASGVGYGEGYAANSHTNAPSGWLPAIEYLVEELGADVNARDHEGNTALHHAAARGDNDVIRYLVSKGADVKAVNRAGETTVDMANGPVQRTQPFPETIKLLESLGAKNNHRCKSC